MEQFHVTIKLEKKKKRELELSPFTSYLTVVIEPIESLM